MGKDHSPNGYILKNLFFYSSHTFWLTKLYTAFKIYDVGQTRFNTGLDILANNTKLKKDAAHRQVSRIKGIV